MTSNNKFALCAVLVLVALAVIVASSFPFVSPVESAKQRAAQTVSAANIFGR